MHRDKTKSLHSWTFPAGFFGSDGLLSRGLGVMLGGVGSKDRPGTVLPMDVWLDTGKVVPVCGAVHVHALCECACECVSRAGGGTRGQESRGQRRTVDGRKTGAAGTVSAQV